MAQAAERTRATGARGVGVMTIATPGREVYIPRKFQAKTLAMIAHANGIIEEYVKAGFKLTLRQLYYQFVARDLFANTGKNYGLLKRTMQDARNAGESDWYAMEDRSRRVNSYAAWVSPKDFISSEIEFYAEDLWDGQRFCPEVWVEKDALIGIVAAACEDRRVPHFSIHGNVGQLMMHDAGKRFAAQLGLGLLPIVIYLGDHDPSGIAMTKDIERRLEFYAGEPIEVRRIALNMDQVRQYHLPPNFAKEKDPNLSKYIREFGTDKCWELDALAPDVIAALIRDEVEDMIDEKKWAAAVRSEQRNRKVLSKIASEIR
jgi:hypothetical protein